VVSPAIDSMTTIGQDATDWGLEPAASCLSEHAESVQPHST